MPNVRRPAPTSVPPGRVGPDSLKGSHSTGQRVKVWHNSDLLSFSHALPDFTAGKSTPREFLEQCLDAIAARDKRVKAFVTLNLVGARKSADAATKRYESGKPLSPVDGCPIAVKDIIETADMPTGMNSSLFKGWRSKHDAACVFALRCSGAVIIGKTVTTEFAIGRSGPTTNPFDVKRTPGGSSSGSAAAVACGMVPVALGTQTIGSILRPASYCGTIGFKPTAGTLHMGGIHPISATCDHLGIIAGSLEDTWRVASQISLTLGSPGNQFLPGAVPPAPRKPRKLARLYTRGWLELDRETREIFNEVLAALEARGVKIESREHDPELAILEDELDGGVADGLAIVAYEMKWPYGEYVARFGRQIGPRIRELVSRGYEMTQADYKRLLVNRRRIQSLVQKWSSSCDVFITLAASGPAKLGLSHTGSRTFPAYSSWLGFPAFTLPLMEVNGLPVGIQLLGAGGADAELCAIANWVMRELG
jgi:Asp-tRNA(Asn)/Glu-tRNA(Gln) amidotransferase A subunit family amidase